MQPPCMYPGWAVAAGGGRISKQEELTWWHRLPCVKHPNLAWLRGRSLSPLPPALLGFAPALPSLAVEPTRPGGPTSYR